MKHIFLQREVDNSKDNESNKMTITASIMTKTSTVTIYYYYLYY